MRTNVETRDFSFLRRRLLQGLALSLAPSPLMAQNGGPAIRLRKLNNFTIRVSDPDRTVGFYQALFGMPLQSRQAEQVNLAIGEGPQFMGVRPLRPGESPAITHIGYSVEDYESDRLGRELAALGYERLAGPPDTVGLHSAMKTWTREAGGLEVVHFVDARGLEVQLVPAGYCGGSDGGGCAPSAAAPEGLMRLHEINHFTAFVNDGAGANRYYQQTFGLRPQAYQGGPGSPVTGIGDGYQFVMYAGPFPGGEDAPAVIHHGCFSMHDFNVEEVIALLESQGLRPRGDGPAGPLMHYISLRMPERGGAEGGTPELYFTDPDGILMQLQHTSYCGGGGKLGEICL